MDVGFVGLGIMGRPMAGHLIRGGHAVHLHSRRGVPEELRAAGGRPCASARAVAERSEVTFAMVTDTADVVRVLFGPDGAADALGPGKVFVDMGSTSPAETRRLATRVRALGAEYVDAPVSGGDVGAREASLTIMVGGGEEAFARVLPLLRLLGRRVTHVGPTGDGQICKVANQVAVALHIQAAAEALLLASRAGADPVRVREALLGGFAASRVLELHGERMIERRFEPGARIALHQKDLGNALDTARALGVALPGTALAQQLFSACTAAGGDGWDHSAMVRALEMLAGHEIGKRRDPPGAAVGGGAAGGGTAG
jgi:2-hydroxy-3-oxopropionate reductase